MALIIPSDTGVNASLITIGDLAPADGFFIVGDGSAWVTESGATALASLGLNYTPENTANKSNSYTLSSTTTYATTKALVDGLATKLDASTPIDSKIDQSGGTGDTFGALTGAVNGVNTDFTVSNGQYPSGKLKVFLNGQLQVQGSTEDWVELNPSSGTFRFNTAPVSGDQIAVEYGRVSSPSATIAWGDVTGKPATIQNLTAYAQKTANYTITTNDYIIEAITAGVTITLPSSATQGQVFVILNCSGGTITITSSLAIGNGVSGNPTSVTQNANSSYSYLYNGTLWRYFN